MTACNDAGTSALQRENKELQDRINDLENRLNDSGTSQQRTKTETEQLRAKVVELVQQNSILGTRLQDSESKSRKLKDQSDSFLQSEGTIEVRLLKVYDFGGAAYADFYMSNKSPFFLNFWSVGADAFSSGGTYLGHYDTNGSNLRPGQSVTAKLIFSDVSASNVATWKPAIAKIVVGLPGGDISVKTEKFTLKELK